jgi:hypothetical protein
MRIPGLQEILLRDGYSSEDTIDIYIAYLSGGIEAAVDAFKWADDTEHDYSGELRRVIQKWQTEKDGWEEVATSFLIANSASAAFSEMVNKEIYMEDIITISLDAIKVMEDGLKKLGITLTDAQVDEIYVPMLGVLEKLSKWPDYRHEH